MRLRLPSRLAPWTALAVAAAAGLLVLCWSVAILAQDRYGSGLTTIWEPINARPDEPAPEITRGVEVTQTFVSLADGLREVDIQMATFDRANTATLVFILSRENNTGQAALRQLEIPASDIRDNDYFAFIFDPIADSSGDRFAVTLTSPGGRRGSAVTAWTGLCDCYADGSLYIDGEEEPGRELTMRVAHASGPASVSEELVNRMSQYKPELVKGASLVFLGALSVVLALMSIAYFTVGLAQRIEPEFQWPWVAISLVFVIGLIPLIW